MTIGELNRVIAIRTIKSHNTVIEMAWHTINFLNTSLADKWAPLDTFLTAEESHADNVCTLSPSKLDSIKKAKALGLPVPEGF